MIKIVWEHEHLFKHKAKRILVDDILNFYEWYNLETILEELWKLKDITKEPTWFTNNWNILVTYNWTNRTITLNWDFQAYCKWRLIPELTDWRTSAPHADIEWTYFLHYTPTWFVFDIVPRQFDCLQIAFAQYNSHKIWIRETHWFMQRQAHKEFHENIWTYRVSWWEFNSFTLNSTTPANRRPNIASLLVADEDNPSQIKLLNTKKYTQRYLTWTWNRTFSTQQNDIVSLNWNIPRYNYFNGSSWVFWDIPNNNYAAIFIVWVPVTDDVESQEYRYMFVQPQQYWTLSTIQWLTPNNLTHWDSSTLLSEFVFFGKIIIQVLGWDWKLISTELISWNRISQIFVTWNYIPLSQANQIELYDWFKLWYDLYSEFVIVWWNITQINYRSTSWKTLKLFTKDITYVSWLPTVIAIKDEITGKTLTQTNVYSWTDIISVNKVLS